MPHSFSHAVSMNLEHSIKEGSHERYPDHLQCFRNIKKKKYPDFQAMTLAYAITQFFRPVTWCKGYKYNKKCALYIFVYDEYHERYSPLKIMSLKGQMQNYRMKYTGEGISLTLVRSWTYDTMTISWGGVQVMNKSDPINLPVTVTVEMRHNIMTRRIAQQLGEVQYMLKQGSSWHDITDYYRTRKKAVNLKVETGDKGVTNSPKKVRREKSQKKTKVHEEPVNV